jgi:hypothetical protein
MTLPSLQKAGRWADIPGWFDWAPFYRQAVENAEPGGVLVECGVFLGRSLKFLEETAAQANKNLTVVGYDRWCITPAEMGADVQALAGPLLERYGSHEAAARALLADPMLGDRVEAAGHHGPASVDMVWLDDDHNAEHLYREIIAWWHTLKPGGTIGGHDFDWPSVYEAVLAAAKKHEVAVQSIWPRSWCIELPL